MGIGEPLVCKEEVPDGQLAQLPEQEEAHLPLGSVGQHEVPWQQVCVCLDKYSEFYIRVFL